MIQFILITSFYNSSVIILIYSCFRDREWFMEQLNIQLGIQYEQTIRSLCSSDRSLIFCDFLNKNSMYEEIVDITYLREFIENKLNEYNSAGSVIPMNLVLFKDAIDHICRINRVITQPRGYILLVGIGIKDRLIKLLLGYLLKPYEFSNRWFW